MDSCMKMNVTDKWTKCFDNELFVDCFADILLLDEKGVTVASTDNELAQSTKACASEGDLIDAFVDLVHRCDPDIIVGYEVSIMTL